MTAAEHFRRRQQILESCFPAGWLSSTAAAVHPARQDWELCELLRRQNGSLQYPEQRRLLPHLARLTLDTHAWLNISQGGDAAALQLGRIDGYGDDGVARKIRSRVLQPRGYSDLLVELVIGGFHRSEGRRVIPYERDSYPDLRVDATEIPLLVECKRLQTTGERRIRKVVQKANKQVKMAAADLARPFDGVVVLDLNGVRAPRFGSSEWTPTHVEEAIGAARRALSGEKNRSIRQALVVWDYYAFSGNDRAQTLTAYVRACAAVDHTGPVLAEPCGITGFEGQTAVSQIDMPAEIAQALRADSTSNS